jgi:hypothetical protein
MPDVFAVTGSLARNFSNEKQAAIEGAAIDATNVSGSAKSLPHRTRRLYERVSTSRITTTEEHK